MKCPSCEILYINGIRTHETGCPEAWKGSPRPCFQCGYDFIPEERFQNVCPDCIEDLNKSMYGGIDDPDDPDDDL